MKSATKSTRERLLEQALYKSGESFTAAEIASRLAVSTSNAKYVCTCMVQDGELDSVPVASDEPERFKMRIQMQLLRMKWRC